MISLLKSKSKLILVLSAIVFLLSINLKAVENKTPSAKSQPVKYEEIKNIYYHSTPQAKADSYLKEKCTLDVHYPINLQNVPVIIWIHGGGLRGGKKIIPNKLRRNKMVIIGIDYRVTPKVKCPVYLQDAAEAVNWVFKNCKKYNGDPKRIYLSGHSAGGYLTAMLGMDPKWLAAHELKPTDLRAICPMSGMMTTHFTIKKEKTGETDSLNLWIDDYSPIRHAAKNLPPILLITGDREMDWPGRWEENLLLQRILKARGHKDVTFFEMGGYGHSMMHPGIPAFLSWINKRDNTANKK